MSYTASMSKAIGEQKRATKSFRNISTTLCIWFATLCWGGAYVAARFLLTPNNPGFVSLSPTMLATLRFSIASLIFLVPLGRAILHHQVNARDLLLLFLLGQFAFTLYYWLQYIGIQQTNASIASLLGVGLIPLFTTLLAFLFRTERFNIAGGIALFLGFTGVALIVFQKPVFFTFRSGFLFGALCLIINTFFFALYTNLSKRWMQNMSPLTMTAGTMISGTIGLLILSFFSSLSQWREVALLVAPQWLALLFLALGCSVLAYFAYNVALSRKDASGVALYFYFEPIVAVVLGITLLGEQLTWQTTVGAIVIGGSALVVSSLKRTKN